MEEPSVLDYLKDRLRPWRKPDHPLPKEPLGESVDKEVVQPSEVARPVQAVAVEKQAGPPIRLPWRSFLALGLAMLAQITLQPGPNRDWLPGVLLYLASAASLVWSVLQDEWKLAPLPEGQSRSDPLTVRWVPAVVGLLLAGLVFLTSGGNRLNLLNLSLLVLGLGLLAWGFWPARPHDVGATDEEKKPGVNLVLDGWAWLVVALFVAAIIIRFLNFDSLPAEMTSDHAEKILDLQRVLNGETKIFFPTNGGREALHFYLLAALHNFFGVELGFGLLKLSTILVGLLALPFLYFLGIEIANRRVGWLAVAFATVAYWPYVITRVGLRFPFFVLFTASTLLFLLRGLRTQNRVAFILAGVSLGLSFYGYSADRILPLVVIGAVTLFLLHRQSQGQRRQTIWLTILLFLFAVVLLLPLIRYIVDEPSDFMMRTLTRMSGLEKPLDAPAWLIFSSNVSRALVMFFWDDGEVWLASIPHRPALEVVTAALFFSGLVLVFIRYLRNRHWLDIFLLVSIPLLMLPSIMSLAFPNENPNLYRTGGAIIPVFLLIALSLDGLMSGIQVRWQQSSGSRIAWGFAIGLLVLTAVQSYNLLFDQYDDQYRLSAWNTSEMGSVMRNFSELTGLPDNAWVIPYPYWVDTRLVGMNAGYPTKDYALSVEQVPGTLAVRGAKLFLLKPEDQAAMDALRQTYPQGWFQEFQSKILTKNFLVFQVPPEDFSLEAETPVSP
jgi:hypothetical protein